MQMENKDLCSKCGECCKNCGCEFSADDFSQITIEELQKHLDSGLISIACDIGIDIQNNLIVYLFVRMRNVGREEVDFFHIFPIPCNALTMAGCPYSFANRPSGGKNLIPKENKECYYLTDVSTTWEPYQDILRQLVIKNIGLTPEEKVRERIEDIIYNFLQIGIEDESIKYYLSFLGRISLSFFEQETMNAIIRCTAEKKLNRTNPLLKCL